MVIEVWNYKGRGEKTSVYSASTLQDGNLTFTISEASLYSEYLRQYGIDEICILDEFISIINTISKISSSKSSQ